jgi:hypothetical protein
LHDEGVGNDANVGEPRAHGGNCQSRAMGSSNVVLNPCGRTRIIA